MRMSSIAFRAPRGSLSALAGAFAGFAIVVPVLWFLAPVALALFFADLVRARTLKGAFLRGLVFSLMGAGAGIGWFWETLPLGWMGVEPSKQWYYVFACWGAVTIVMGIAGALVSLLIWRLRRIPLFPLAAAALWVAAEEAKMWAFALLTYEERSLMGAHFSATSLGYPVSEQHYLLQLAAVGGLAALTFFCALLGAALAEPWRDARAKRLSLGASAAALVALLATPVILPAPEQSGEPLVVALYTTDLAFEDPRGDGTAAYLSALADIGAKVPDADVAVLPEDFRLEPSFPSMEARAEAAREALGRDALIVGADHRLGADTFTLELSFLTTGGELLGAYSKMFLMPGGEYLPYYLQFAFSLVPDQGLGSYAGTLKHRELPGEAVSVVPYRGWTIAGFVCSDFLSPVLHADAARLGADLFITSANPVWFHHSRVLQDKMEQMGKVHAVAHRAYYLMASNGAPSFAIDPEGRIVAETPWGFVGPLRVEVR